MATRRHAVTVGMLATLCGGGGTTLAATPVGIKPFVNSRDPPFYRNLDAATLARARLGHAVFNTQFVPTGTADAARIDGIGPLFNSASCDECHNEGADARGPRGNGGSTLAHRPMRRAPGTHATARC